MVPVQASSPGGTQAYPPGHSLSHRPRSSSSWSWEWWVCWRVFHRQGHHRHHVPSWGTCSAGRSSCKQQRPEVKEGKKPFFHLACHSPALGSQTINTFLGNWLLAKLPKGVFHTPPVFVKAWPWVPAKLLNPSQGHQVSMLRTFKHGCQPLLLNQYPKRQVKIPFILLGRTLYMHHDHNFLDWNSN